MLVQSIVATKQGCRVLWSVHAKSRIVVEHKDKEMVIAMMALMMMTMKVMTEIMIVYKYDCSSSYDFLLH